MAIHGCVDSRDTHTWQKKQRRMCCCSAVTTCCADRLSLLMLVRSPLVGCACLPSRPSRRPDRKMADGEKKEEGWWRKKMKIENVAAPSWRSATWALPCAYISVRAWAFGGWIPVVARPSFFFLLYLDLVASLGKRGREIEVVAWRNPSSVAAVAWN